MIKCFGFSYWTFKILPALPELGEAGWKLELGELEL